jgi:hypothetical protein
VSLSRKDLRVALTAAIANPDIVLARLPPVLRGRVGDDPVLLPERQIAAAVAVVMALQREDTRRKPGRRDCVQAALNLAPADLLADIRYNTRGDAAAS